MKRSSSLWTRRLETLETRCCLSAVAFVPRELTQVDCCLGDLADVDGDQDLDILTDLGSTAQWYENLDGRGELGNPNPIVPHLYEAGSLKAVDVDGDGDNDLVGALTLNYESQVRWYENQDGRGEFGPPQVIAQGPGWANSESKYGFSDGGFADLDGDGDIDLVTPLDSEIVWYENVDGSGNFSEPQPIIPTAGRVTIADIDADGDLDVVRISVDDMTLDDIVAWYPNLGGGESFGPERIVTIQASPRNVVAHDVDGDGDVDLILEEKAEYRDQLVWRENIDGLGSFGDARLISADSGAGNLSEVVDIDSDGDLDILMQYSAEDISRIAFHENLDGRGEFSGEQLIANGRMTGVVVGDFDGDSAVDVMANIHDDDRHVVTWFQNRLIGDADRDGDFDASDLIAIFELGRYEDAVAGNADFDQGDWNQDGKFDSSDIILAFQAGHYRP